MNRRRLLLLLPSLALILLILTDLLPWLRGPAPETSEWYWPYLLRPFTRWWLPILAALIFLLIARWWLHQPENSRRRDLVALLLLTSAMIGLQLALIYPDQPDVLAGLIDRTLSNLASGYFEPAANITDLSATLHDYPQVMPTFAAEHARTHPPGLIIANNRTIALFDYFPDLSLTLARWVYPNRCTDLWLLQRPFPVAAALFIWSWLPLLAAALTIWPGYWLARQWLAPSFARLATLLIATLPALLIFAPKVIQLYPPLVLLLFGCLVCGLRQLHWTWLLAAGLLYSLLTFLSLGNLALALPIALYALLDLQRTNRLKIAIIIKTAVPLISGGMAFWLLFWLGWNVPPWAIIQTGLDQHYELVTLLRRYDWWIVWNLVDVLVYAGWPLVLGFGLAVTTLRHRRLGPINQLTLSLVLLLLILNFSGTARGEVGRLWIFFMPLLALPAASHLADWLPSPRYWLVMVGLQLATAVALSIAWQPVRPVIVITQPPEMPTEIAPQTAFTTIFNESIGSTTAIQLIGTDLPPATAVAGDTLPFTLYWQADHPTLRPYTVFNHLLDANSNLVAQQDNWPVNNQWPSTCWPPNQPIRDNYQMHLPSDLPAGIYTLVTGLYDAQNGTRLKTTTGAEQQQLTQIELK